LDSARQHGTVTDSNAGFGQSLNPALTQPTLKMTLKRLTCLALLGMGLTHSAVQAAEKTPEIFDGLLLRDKPIKGQIGLITPPQDMDKFVAKVAAAARKDPEWYKQYLAKNPPGAPLPFDEKLGLTKEEYAEYLKLWGQREFKASEEVLLLLRESSPDAWIITATGSASTISTLRYHPATDTFRSPNGKLVRIEDIDASPDSILGAWKGREWRYEEETSLGKTKENIALGRAADGKHGLLVYRVQELSDAGTRLLDKSLIVRFPLPKAK